MGRDRRRLFAFLFGSGGGGGGGPTAQFIYPATFGNVATFHVANILGPPQAITASRHVNTNAFHTAVVFRGNAVNANLFTNSNTFYASAVSIDVWNVSASILTDGDAFYTADVTRSTMNITASRHINTNTFYTATAAIGATNIVGSRHVNANVFATATVSHTATLDSFVLDVDALASSGLGDQITGSLFVNANAFQSASLFMGWTVTASKHTNVPAFHTSVTTRGVRTITASKHNNTNVFRTNIVAVVGGGIIGWPNASNTGVPVGTTLVSSGNITTTSNGQVIQDRLVTGKIQVNHTNVIIRRCRVLQSDFIGIQVGSPGNSLGAGCIIEDTELDGRGGHGGIAFWTPQGQTAGRVRRCNIHSCENCVNIEGPVIIEDNYMHDMDSNDAAPHYDTIECNGSQNFTISHNNMINDFGQTAVVMLNDLYQGLSNITVTNNRMIGGGYTLYCADVFGGGPVQGSTIIITNNRMISGQYGYWALYTSNPVVSGNVNDTTGADIDP